MQVKDRVVLVFDGGAPHGRAIALALSAKGAKVVVAGSPEKDLGETVGYVVFGGGAARHYPGPDPAGAVEKARTSFGGLDLVIGPQADVDRILSVAPVASIVVPSGTDEDEAVRLSSSDPRPAP